MCWWKISGLACWTAWGLMTPRLKALRPSLVICSINGFGGSGPYKDRPAFDFIAQAMSGFMSVNGRADDPPMRSGLPISDLVAGLYAALSITAAIPHARATGQGQRAEVSLTNGLVSLLAYIATNYLRHRRCAGPQRQRPSHRRAVWAVSDPGRADRPGPGGRRVLPATGGCTGGTRAENRSALRDAVGSGGEPGADQRHRRRQTGRQHDSLLGGDAERGRRALRAGQQRRRGVPGPADPGTGDGSGYVSIPAMASSACWAFPSSCRKRHAACGVPLLRWANIPMRSWRNWAAAKSDRAAWRQNGVI